MRTRHLCPGCETRPVTGRHFRGEVALCGECFATKTAGELEALQEATPCDHADEIVEADANVYCSDCGAWLANEAHPGMSDPTAPDGSHLADHELGGIDEAETGWTGR